MRGKKIQGYVITRQLGAGGMGQVFEGLRDVRVLMEERKQDASGIISRLTSGKKAEGQSLDQALDSLAEQINDKLLEFSMPSERTEFYKTAINRISPDLSLDECRRAIKIMKPKPKKDGLRSEERFEKETQAQARVNHPNVARVYEGGETIVTLGSKQFPLRYIIMEYVEVGRDLEKAAFGDLQEAVRVAYDSLKGIEAVHAHGFLHRDIKPRNILYGKDGIAKLTDFGLVKAIDKDNTLAQSLTADGDVVGTPHYLPPEVARGQDATTASDLYSLGATFYCFVTGMPPVQNTERGAAQTLGEIANENDTAPWVRRRNSSVSTEVERLIMKMLAKNPEERPTIQEAKEEMEHILERGLFVYEAPTMEQELQRMQNIELLKKAASKWGADHRARASTYEQLGNLYIAENQQEINARIDAYEQAIVHHRKAMPITRTGREQVENKISKLKKEIAFEHRRIKELNKDFSTNEQISRTEKKPKNRKKTTLATAAALAGFTILGSLGYLIIERNSRKEQETVRIQNFNTTVEQIERSLAKKDYAKVAAEIKKAEEDAKVLPGTYALKIRELAGRVENAQTYDKAAASYMKAKEAIVIRDFAATRTSAEQGNSLENKLSDAQLKKKLDWAKVELGESVYTAVEDLLQKEEPRGAATGLGIITWLLDKTTAPELKERSEALRARVKTAESRIAQYAPQIKIFEEQIHAREKLDSDYTKINEQLKENKFCKREEIDQLSKTLDGVFAKLSGISQNAVGREEYNRQSLELVKARNKMQNLKKDFDSQLITFLTQQSQKIEPLIIIEDYTQADVPEKLRTALGIMQDAKAQYENAKTVSGFSALERKLDSQSTQLQSLQEKTLVYTALTRQAAQGANLEKATANTSLLKIYIEFGRLAEAEKCLAAIPNKTGLETYTTILELEKRLSNPTQVATAPEGFNEEIAKNYVSLVNAYKKDNKLTDHLKLYIALISDKTGANMSAAQLGISDVRDLEDQIAELKQKTQTLAVKKQLEDQNKLLEERRKTVYALLDSYVKPTTGTAQETVKQLQNAYRAAGYEKQAAEVPRRFK